MIVPNLVLALIASLLTLGAADGALDDESKTTTTSSRLVINLPTYLPTSKPKATTPVISTPLRTTLPPETVKTTTTDTSTTTTVEGITGLNIILLPFIITYCIQIFIS